jgi:uncharacterized protein YcbK (DUF882 family)
MDATLLRKLQMLRDNAAEPLVITSGYRCPKHNAAIGGSANSYHMKGMAVDIACDGKDKARRYKLVKLALALDFGGVEVSGVHIHLDVRPPSQGVMLLMDKDKVIF